MSAYAHTSTVSTCQAHSVTVAHKMLDIVSPPYARAQVAATGAGGALGLGGGGGLGNIPSI